MAISDSLAELATDISNAYDGIENKGGTLPQNKNTNNLATAIDSIQTGITPSGTINITENGPFDVTQYVTADVNVQIGNVKMVQFTPEQLTTTVTIPLEKRPWIIMIDCGTDLGITGISSYVLTRYISVYSRYGSGGFVGTRATGTNSNGGFEHYTVTNPTYSNGELILYSGSTRWGGGRTYNMYYIDEEEV